MTDKADVWMPFFVGDYLADTMHLTRDQHGGYLLLLFAMWKRAGEIPDDDGQLAAIAKATPAEWRKLRPVLEPFFEVGDGRWVKGRVLRDLQQAKVRKAKAVAKAKAGAAGRYGKVVDNYASRNAPSDASSMPQAMPEGMLEHCPPSSSLIHSVVNPRNTAHASHTPGDKDRLEKHTVGNGAWRRDPNQAAAKGREVGIEARRGESTDELVRRIDAAVEMRNREART